MVYLYAIIKERERPPEALRGVDYASLVYVHGNGLTAVVSHLGVWGVAPTPRRLWQHEQVVEALMMDQAVLPARFSTILEDEAAVQNRLEAFSEVYEQELERMHGRVELSLRVIRLWEPYVGGDGVADLASPELSSGAKTDLSVQEKTGRTYDVARRSVALQRRMNRRRNESLAELIHRPLAPLTTDHTLHVEETPGVLIKAAYLVDKKRLVDMQRAVRGLMHAYPHLHFLCTGPWPPYHFVDPIEPVKKVA